MFKLKGRMPTMEDLVPKDAGRRPVEVGFANRQAALTWLAEKSGFSVAAVENDPQWAFRRAAKKVHPDHGGDPLDLARLCAARECLNNGLNR